MRCLIILILLFGILILGSCKNSDDFFYGYRMTDDVYKEIITMYDACKRINTMKRYENVLDGKGLEFKARFQLDDAWWISGFGKVKLNGYLIAPLGKKSFDSCLFIKNENNGKIIRSKNPSFTDFILNNNENEEYLRVIISFTNKYRVNEARLIDVYSEGKFLYSYLTMTLFTDPREGYIQAIFIPDEDKFDEIYKHHDYIEYNLKHRKSCRFDKINNNLFIFTYI